MATAAVLFAVMCLSGCGGGGGGGTVGVGDRGGDGVSPILTVSSPAQGALVSDVDFRATSFVVTISYADTSPMSISTLKVTMKLDNGAEQTVTSYFTAPNASTLQSNNIYTATRAMLPLISNDTSHTVTRSAKRKESEKNEGTTTSTFTVYPAGAPAPQ